MIQVNNFKQVRHYNPNDTLTAQKHLEKTWRARTAKPIAYDRHFHFIDFRFLSDNGNLQPIWFTMLRDPVSKFESEFHFFR